MSETEGQESASQAWMRGDMQRAQELNQPIADDQPAGNGASSQAVDDIAFAPMPDAPKLEEGEVSGAMAKLAQMGGEHAQLVQKWGADAGENLAYAKAAFREVATTRPDLIAKFEASGLGDDASVIEFLAQHGRLQAGMTGDFTVARNGSSPSAAPAFRGGGGSKAALLAELSQIRKDNPVGTEKYKNPAVQRRITQINETLYPGDIVGRGGRTA
jgi:hypothetical protein